MISVIIPALNESASIAAAVGSARCHGAEVLVVDGGSTDGTAQSAAAAGARVIGSPPGRAKQMNAGAREAAGEILLFLHADTCLPPNYVPLVCRAIGEAGTVLGCFRLGIRGTGRNLRLIEAGTDLRVRQFGLPYGDQALFLRAAVFRQAGGFADIPLFEDVELVRRLKRMGRVRVLAEKVLTSDRRWRRHGVWRTTVLNQILVLAYLLGLSPRRLARWY